MMDKAPTEYVLHTVLRLKDLAKERRFKAHLEQMKKQKATAEEKDKIREQWTDEIPLHLRDQYKELLSSWDCAKADHRERLGGLMEEWLIKEAVNQAELEARLMQFTFTNDPREAQENTDANKPSRSFKDVVAETEEQPTKQNGEDNENLQKWYQLCMKKAEPIRVLRDMTDEEKQAIEMILHHQLEVPIPPRFLIQIMDARELAAFTDLFMAIEYPLYAHLLPGQRFGPNMSIQAILQHMNMGAEAAYPQKMQIMEFKRDISRAEINTETRVVKVTFKGKNTAMKWVGWGMPLGMRMLKLVDYETQREEAKTNNALIHMDFYRFTIAAKRGCPTSSDLYWILSQKIGVRVQALAHVETGDGNVNDKQWNVSIKAEACPANLRRVSSMVVGDISLTVYHHEVYPHWPCTLCGAPDHSGRFCRTLPERIKETQQNHAVQLEGKLPSQRGKGGREYGSNEHPTTIEQLLAQVKGRQLSSSSQILKQGREKQQVADGSERPSIPKDWEQARWATEAPKEPDHLETSNTWCSAIKTSERTEATEAHKETGVNAEGDQPTQDGGSDDEEEDWYMSEQDEAPAEQDARHNRTDTGVNEGGHRAEKGEQASRPEQAQMHDPRSAKRRSEAGTAEHDEHTRSLSPKRQLSENWKLGSDNDNSRSSKALKKNAAEERDTKHQETNKHGSDNNIQGGRRAVQKYMHNYVTSATTKQEETESKRAQPREQEENQHLNAKGFLMTGVKEGDDHGLPLIVWLDIVGGTITDVAANGHCGWLAFLAAIHNVREGLKPVETATAEAANILKKQVINSMIANLVDEAEVHEADFVAAVEAIGKDIPMQAPKAEKLKALANHYADQRNRSTKAFVPMNYWVRPEHIKAMAMHAREMVYVLDVLQDENTRLQVYGYNDVELPDKTVIESGMVMPLPSQKGADLLRDLIAAGTLPIIMILRYSGTGNHYQAVTYEATRYQEYTERWRELTESRNNIITKYGGRGLDPEPYDPDKTARAAARELKAIRREAKKLETEARDVQANEQEMKRGSEPAQAEGVKEGQSSNNYLSEEEIQSEPTKNTATEDRKLDGGARPGGKSNKTEAIVTAPTAHYPPSVTLTHITKRNEHEEKPKELTAVAPERQERPTTQAGDGGTM
ncbi:hypothetical protein DVH05_000435 [Phytophthora capsici]|nr:hypothetical protein DVH05_000435 [Phytophthora capsici]